MVTNPEDDLVRACRILGNFGHADTVWGHVAVRIEQSDLYLMKGAGVGLDETTTQDLVVIDRHGVVREGSRRCHKEFPIHTEILAANEHLNAVVHTHPPYGVAFGATSGTLRPIGHEGAYFAPSGVPRFEATSDLIVTAELGASVASTLGDARALFLRNHGVVAVGRNIQEATMAATLLEKACFIQLTVGASDHTWTFEEEAIVKRGRIYDEASLADMWDYYVRRLGSKA